MKHRLFVIICVLLTLCVAGGVAYAIYSKSVPSHVKVIQPAPALEIKLAFYEDEGCTQPCSFVEWGELQRGMDRTISIFYVKNVGNISVTVSGNSTLPVEVGNLDIKFKEGPDWQPELQLDVAQVCEVKGTMSIDSSAPITDTTFDIVVKAQ